MRPEQFAVRDPQVIRRDRGVVGSLGAPIAAARDQNWRSFRAQIIRSPPAALLVAKSSMLGCAFPSLWLDVRTEPAGSLIGESREGGVQRCPKTCARNLRPLVVANPRTAPD